VHYYFRKTSPAMDARYGAFFKHVHTSREIAHVFGYEVLFDFRSCDTCFYSAPSSIVTRESDVSRWNKSDTECATCVLDEKRSGAAKVTILRFG
jgi:hypothetical protein